jgi:hypothetical protein
MRSASVLLLVLMLLALSGCAAIPLAALGASAFGEGAKAAVNAGAEYTSGGAVLRTFSLPLDELRLAVGDTLARMEIAVWRDEVVDDERRIVARARDRELQLRLEPVTRTVTRLRIVVSEGYFRKDRATATEIVTQTERTVEARVAASMRTDRPATRDARAADASCPSRVARARETPRAPASPPCRGSDGTRPRPTSTPAG